jgi:hypothetical protein
VALVWIGLAIRPSLKELAGSMGRDDLLETCQRVDWILEVVDRAQEDVIEALRRLRVWDRPTVKKPRRTPLWTYLQECVTSCEHLAMSDHTQAGALELPCRFPAIPMNAACDLP